MDSLQNNASSSRRFVFLDLVRFLAIVLMIQGHTFDAIFPFPATGAWLIPYQYVHGLVAPLFYISSGFAFFVATWKRWDVLTHWSKPLQKRLLRFSSLIVLGYILHAPAFSFARIIGEARAGRLGVMIQVDTLQLIGLTLLALQILVLLTRTPKRFALVSSILAFFVVFATPWFSSVEDGSGLPAILSAYINYEHGSLFPIFNWSGFLLIGTLIGYLYMDARERGTESRMMHSLSLISALLFVGMILSQNVRIPWYPNHDFYRADPIFFLMRFGVVGLILYAAWITERLLPRIAPWVTTIGKQSLTIYVLHMIIVYGSPINPGLGTVFGKVFTLSQSLIIAGAIISSMLAIALSWNSAKKSSNRLYPAIQLVGGALLLSIFLFA